MVLWLQNKPFREDIIKYLSQSKLQTGDWLGNHTCLNYKGLSVVDYFFIRHNTVYVKRYETFEFFP